MEPMLELRPGNNALHESGDLDGQIAADFGALADAYAASGENGPRVEYARRIEALAREAARGAQGAMDMEAFLSMDPASRHAYVINRARKAVMAVGRYDPRTITVERQSLHPDDWYLWSVAACHESTHEWSAWTLNLSIGGLHGGHYNMKSTKDVARVFAAKKGVALAAPKRDDDNEEEG